ncbi:MAG: hypothetical protein RL641_23 [Candidatus Parcubacteria bacterium]|jgi:hypothetical protein
MKSHHVKISLLLFIASMLTIMLGQVSKAENVVAQAQSALLASALSPTPTFSMYVDNESYTSDKTYEFDVAVKSTTPGTSINLFTAQIGLNYNPNWTAGGTVVPSLASYGGNGKPGTISNRASNLLITAISGGSRANPVFTMTPQERGLYRVKVTNSVPFACENPNLKFTFGFGGSQVKSMKTIVYYYLPESSKNANLTSSGLYNGSLFSDGPQNVSSISPEGTNALPPQCEKNKKQE